MCLYMIVYLMLVQFTQAEQGYNSDQQVWNNGTIYILNNEGLTGSFAEFYANTTLSAVDYLLWFANTSTDSFTLSIVASNLPVPTDGPVGWIPKDLQTVEGRIIWTANRDRPVKRDAVLNFTAQGNLELWDADGTLVWETNTSNKDVYRLWMTDAGTLALKDEQNKSVSWESSDFPTDCLMENHTLKAGSSLTSSINDLNTSRGLYNLVLDPHDGLVMYASMSTERQVEPYWRQSATGRNSLSMCDDGKNLQLQLRTSLSETSCGISDDRVSLNLTSSRRYETFIRLQPDGDLHVYAWAGTNWSRAYALFENETCRLPLKCGPYGICHDGQCEGCHSGEDFKLLDPSRKELGCKVEDIENCKRTTFIQLDGYGYFASNYSKEVTTTISSKDCKGKCNCSCKAAFYNELSNGSRYCFTTANVGTIQRTLRATDIAFLRVPARPKKKRTAIIVGGVVGGVAAILLLTCLLEVLRRSKSGEGSDEDNQEDSMLELSVRSVLPTRYSYQELEVITSGFSSKLGAGAFGCVYKGELADGTQVAVKKLEKSDANLKEFYAEISSMARNRHWHLLQLLGYSMRGPNRLLVYEYMANGSLDAWLFKEEKRQVLSWKTRCNIALGTAKGLAYLHEECSEKILHLDLKPQNILLDSQFNAKIGDFGLSKLVDRDQSMVMTMMRGTPGYLAPEWLLDGVISEKADVYSFGVVLLELVTGRKSRELLAAGSSKGQLRLLAMKDQQHDGGETLLELVDVAFSHKNEEEAVEMKRALRVGVLCNQDEPSERPSMSKVVQMLEGTSPIAKLSSTTNSMNSSI